jgi:diguanylate cyclase (GGDEF)-like protein
MNKILIIDNEYEVAELISEILLHHGYQTKTAINGHSGIRAAASFNPDLILCDISMPELSGYDVLQTLRHDKMTHSIPFIFLTAKTGMQDLRKGMLLGADDYLTKPVSSDELLAAVKTRLEKHQQVISYYRDEIEQTRYNLEMTKNYNSLTGMPNRSVLEKKLGSENFSPGTKKRHTALFIIKFNRFKHLIDILGTEETKRLIGEMVKRIEKLRTGEKNVYYLDDGEFGLLLNNLVNTNTLQPIAQKLLKQIRKPFIWDNTELNCSACIGIALADNPAKRELSLIRHAELALDVAGRPSVRGRPALIRSW